MKVGLKVLVTKPRMGTDKNFLIGSEGVFLQEERAWGKVTYPIVEFPEFQEGLKLAGGVKLYKKIPWELYRTVQQFLREVYLEFGTEAMCQMCWSKKGYYIFIPTQVVGNASVRYERDITKDVVIEFHSHPFISKDTAMFSGIDDNDEKSGIKAVVNKEGIPNFRLRYKQKTIEIQTKDILEEEPTPIEGSMVWRNKVKKEEWKSDDYLTGMVWDNELGHYITKAQATKKEKNRGGGKEWR